MIYLVDPGQINLRDLMHNGNVKPGCIVRYRRPYWGRVQPLQVINEDCEQCQRIIGVPHQLSLPRFEQETITELLTQLQSGDEASG